MSAERPSLIPFSSPSEPDEFERTTAGRKLCPLCGEYAYPRRKAGTSGPFSFAPECELCGEPFTEAEMNITLRVRSVVIL